MGQEISHKVKQTAYDWYYTDWRREAYEWKCWVTGNKPQADVPYHLREMNDLGEFNDPYANHSFHTDHLTYEEGSGMVGAGLGETPRVR